MKSLLTLLSTFLLGTASAQYISGLYAGKLINDSTGKEQQYELALGEYRGQITGYAYTTFIVRDSFYYSIKRVRAVRKNNMLLVEDVKMLAHNFPQPPDKGVKQIAQMLLPDVDTVASFDGAWRTTQTKQFYAIGGGLHLEKADSSGSALIAHLFDLAEIKTAAPKPAVAGTRLVERGDAAVATTLFASSSKTAPPYTQRSTHVISTLNITSDSVVVSFYDNGIVDGDTISVYLDEANIIAQTKLTAVAAKRSIALRTDGQVQRLILVAENLGTIPPNTGLLVVQDGDKKHQIHFTADLQTNAAIELRKSASR